jgi:hypothetical protein
MDGLDERTNRDGSYEGPGASSGTVRQSSERQAEDCDRRSFFAESKDLVGGYTLIEARDLAQAVELSKGCPIFEAESAVLEVRPIMIMNI